MNVTYEWRATSAEIYRAIYREHREALVVFGTHTCMRGCEWHTERYILTEWGFKDADYPIIRSIGRGDGDEEQWSYFVFDGVNREDGEEG